jgi:hypothetical protein
LVVSHAERMEGRYDGRISIHHDVWEIVPRPEGKCVVTSKLAYKIKHVVDGSINKYKERFVARGFSQQEGEEYDETFHSISIYTSIIYLATSMGWILRQMDIKTDFSQWSN